LACDFAYFKQPRIVAGHCAEQIYLTAGLCSEYIALNCNISLKYYCLLKREENLILTKAHRCNAIFGPSFRLGGTHGTTFSPVLGIFHLFGFDFNFRLYFGGTIVRKF
jgi:hypothetical protein